MSHGARVFFSGACRPNFRKIKASATRHPPTLSEVETVGWYPLPCVNLAEISPAKSSASIQFQSEARCLSLKLCNQLRSYIMLIKMLQTRRGSPDGFIVQRYYKGETYDLPELLARRFLNNGWAYNAEPEDDAEGL